MLKRFLALAVGLGLALTTLPARADEVYVFAAASLTNALNEIAADYSAKTGQVVKVSFAASSTLAKQIERGAPAQIYASADLKWMDYLAQHKLIDTASRRDLLGNSLVLIAPSASPLPPTALTAKTDIAALAGSGRIATGNPDSVPAGIYFKQSMTRAGQWSKVAPKIAAAASVRAALALVERGEAPLGAVYATDAAISHKVKVIGTLPDSLHDPIRYPFALVAGKETPAARAFLAALSTPAAKAVFAKYGFTVN